VRQNILLGNRTFNWGNLGCDDWNTIYFLKIGIVMAMFAAVISLLLKQPENQL
jgi:hypothetical protein